MIQRIIETPGVRRSLKAIQSFKKCYGDKTSIEKNELDLTSHHIKFQKLTQNRDLNVRAETIKVLGKNININLCGLRLGTRPYRYAQRC